MLKSLLSMAAFAALVALAACGQRPVPQTPDFGSAPDHVLSFAADLDPREWAVGSHGTNAVGVIVEFYPPGESPEDWGEMVQSQSVKASISHEEFQGRWQKLLRDASSDLEFSSTKLEDGSLLTEYRTIEGDEIGIRRFFQGSDGIYMLAYHVRPERYNAQTYGAWKSIVLSAMLDTFAGGEPLHELARQSTLLQEARASSAATASPEVAWPETIEFMDRVMVVVSTDEVEGQITRKYLEADRSLDDWEHLIVLRSHPSLSPEGAMFERADQLEEALPSTKYLAMSDQRHPEDRVLDHIFYPPANEEGVIAYTEFNNWRFVPGADGMTYSVQYIWRVCSVEDCDRDDLLAYATSWRDNMNEVIEEVLELSSTVLK